MDKFILTGKHGRPSTVEAYQNVKGGNLVQRRQLMSKRKKKKITYYRVYTPQNRTEYIKQKVEKIDAKDRMVIRWGTQEPIETNNKSIVYNKIPGLRIATDKAESRKIMAEKGVSVPGTVTMDNYQDVNYPIIARPPIHSKGYNFIVLKTPKDFIAHYNPEKFYYSEFIDKEREFRVHAGHGKVLALMEKIKPKNPNELAWNRAINDSDPFINVRWGEVDKQGIKCVLDEALKAIDAMGLDMGGVDVMYKDGKAYVLEVNTAPTLNSSPYVANRWGMYFTWLFKKNQRSAHWNWKKFKEGKSLFWKNYQLKDEKKPK